jgi:thioredoxin 1
VVVVVTNSYPEALKSSCTPDPEQPTLKEKEMAQDAKYVTGTDSNFEDVVLNADVPVLVDFWAAWCGPCRMIAPYIEELADEYEGRAKVVKLDVDTNPQTAMQFGVRSIPTLLFFKDGEVADQLIGAAPKKHLVSKLDALVGQPA